MKHKFNLVGWRIHLQTRVFIRFRDDIIEKGK